MVDEKISVIFDGYDENDMGSVVRTGNDIKEILLELNEQNKLIEDKLIQMLKDRKWDTFTDDVSKITINKITKKRESINKKALKMLVTDEQYNQVLITKPKTELSWINAKARARLNKYGRK